MRKNKRKWVWIAGIIVAIILAGAWGVWNLSVQEEKVTISMDKTEYEQGEEIVAILNYEGEIYQWDEYAWSIQRLKNSSWVTILRRGDPYFFCSNMPECEDINLDEIEECPSLVLCERAMWYKVEGVPILIWDQWYKIGEKTFQCKTGGLEEVETWTCVIFDQVPPGRYKIRFEYALTIDLNDRFNRDIDIQYAEKEFVIKQK